MAQSFTNTNGTFVIPGAYPSLQIQSVQSGLSSTGVVLIMGEADSGPDYSQETDLSLNLFGPDQAQSVVAKYTSGQIVDAFLAAANPSNDPLITGSPSAILVVKTNPSTKASAAVLDTNSAAYATLDAKSGGALGNLIYFNVTQISPQVAPSVGPFTWIPNVGAVSYQFNLSGGAIQAPSALSAGTTPASLVSTITALAAGLTATGGTDRGIVIIAGSLATAAPGGNVITVTRTINWTVLPVIGDTLNISATSVIAGAGNANVGGYVVTGVTANSVTATKLSDANKPGAVVGVITAPVVVASTPIASTTADVQSFSPVTIAFTSNAVVDGKGLSLEFANKTNISGDSFSANAYQLSTTPVTWVSTSSTPVLVVSSSELEVSLNDARQIDAVSEDAIAGGEIGLKISVNGTGVTAATVTVSSSTITTSVTGGSVAALTVPFAHFQSLADVAQYINSQTGYSASLGTAVLGSLPGTALDQGTFNILSVNGAQNGRIKTDAYRMNQAVAATALVAFATAPTAGLPLVNANFTYLSGGARGATTNAIIQAALNACQAVNCNFVVPLFSQDASQDIVLGDTDPSSTYTIAAINAAVKSHVLQMSTVKRRKNRQGVVSVRDSFVNDQTSAANLASYRVACTFQDVKSQDSFGNITQQQPWMGAVLAAADQAAGFYRSITHKFINCSGIVDASGDFSDQNDTQVAEALQAGLLPIRRSQTGGFYFVSDQTTWGRDNNFYYNSLQAVYTADIIALTTALRMENQFVGGSTADISAAVALTYLDGIMADFRRLKLISPSDDAPAGFKNAVIQITGTAMIVSLEIKLTGTIYFIPINFLVSQVQQTASQPSTTF